MDIDLDAEDFAQGLERLISELDTNVERALRGGLEVVAATAKELAPKGATSQLANSIAVGDVSGSFVEGTLAGEVFAGAPHALPVEEGARPHVIKARFRRALAWPIEGGFAFAKAVNHPGNRPQPFLRPALERHEADIEDEIAAAVELSLERAGF
jgi:HK97 gp10 family phage protein